MQQENIYYATGKRKSAIARTWLKPGSGTVTINDRPLDDYFKLESARTEMLKPFVITNTEGRFDVRVQAPEGRLEALQQLPEGREQAHQEACECRQHANRSSVHPKYRRFFRCPSC